MIIGRDPKTYRLEGSNDGKAFTLISEGDIPVFTKRKQKKKFFSITINPTAITVSLFRSYRMCMPG